MKKIISIILVFIMTIVILPINAYAEEKVLTIDLSKYLSTIEMSYVEARYFRLITNEFFHEVEENDTTYLADQDDNLLLRIEDSLSSFNFQYTIMDGVNENNNIEYTVPDEYKEGPIFDSIPDNYIYDKVIIKFGKQDFTKEDFIIEVRDGDILFDKSSIADIIAFDSGIFNVKNTLLIRNTSNKILCKVISPFFGDIISIEIPEDVTSEDDIIYNLTAEEQEEYQNTKSKIIYNFSGTNYTDDTSAIIRNMRSSKDDETYYSFLEELIDRNLISEKVIFSIENISGKELLRTDEISTNYNLMNQLMYQPIKIAEGVGEADTITYSLPGTEIGEYLPSNYKRLIIKFIPEEQVSPEPTTPLNVLTNPKTFNNILGIVGLITIISLGTILTKRITKKN